MSKNKKYTAVIEQQGTVWNAKIIRQITSKKTSVSKQQGDFASKADATAWADKQLLEFSATLNRANQRHEKQRKLNQQQKQQRSERRSAKTQQVKQAEQEKEDS